MQGGDGRAPNVTVPKADYIHNLGLIFDAAAQALAPGGTILWVSTTPVPEGDGAPTCGISGTAFNSCVDDYNAAALTLLATKPHVQARVVDLNSAVHQVCGKGFRTCNLQRWHNVHFTDAGKQFCAVEVAAAIAPLLAPAWSRLWHTPL